MLCADRNNRIVRVITCLALMLVACLTATPPLQAAAPEKNAAADTTRGDRMIAEYFRLQTKQLAEESLAEIRTKEDWLAKKDQYRKQLLEMLGLDPFPQKTPLQPKITGTTEHEEFIVENIHFQSRPGLYVTANLYRPKTDKPQKFPAILYVCGHGRVVKDGVSYGNKAHYQHHGAWFARNGYVCLTIDTVQLGELEGMHHGTYRHGQWWWNARGYTPAGAEAWNCIRALDYLETRPEVDAERFGVTGRSGGGAYSWWIAAADERIKVAVPVAGITSLHNHVVDGCVTGHCDCMYQVNTYRWDYPMVAALVAPRPLLISNTDKDRIFPLDGVVDVYNKTRRIYRLLGAEKQIGLQICEGPHLDTQELRIHAFHWFNKYLKGEDPLIETVAVKMFQPEQLQVFTDGLPQDEIVTKIPETFTATPEPPTDSPSAAEWKQLRSGWMTALQEKSFRGWPQTEGIDKLPLDLKPAFSATHENVALSAYDFTSQKAIPLRLYVAHRAGLDPREFDLVVLNVLDEQGWREFLATYQPGFAEQFKEESLPGGDEDAFSQTARMFANQKWGMAYIAPRGIGRTAWDPAERNQTHVRRRFMLLGQTLDGMQTWDAVRAAGALRQVKGMSEVPLWMQGERTMAGVTLYASLFTPDVARLDLWNLSTSHREGPIFLNVLRYLDVPQAVAMAAENSHVRIYQNEKGGWEYPQQVAKSLEWDSKQIQVRVLPPKKPEAEE